MRSTGPGLNVHEESGVMPQDRRRRVWHRDSRPGDHDGVSVRALREIIVPPVCLVCGMAGRDLCGPCRRDLPWLTERRCAHCGLPDHRCGRCPAAGQAFSSSWAPFAHEGPARDLVLALKIRRRTAVAGLLAAAMASNAPVDLLAAPCVIVPVPAHPERRRARGIDHARLLAVAVGGRAGVPCEPRALVRSAGSGRQVGGGREVRLAAAGGTAGVSAGRAATRLRGVRAVLVDDVHTTGATLDACARAVREAGARDAVALTAVRALG